MWKYVSRRIRDTFERSANHFDKRSTTNVVNSNSPVPEENCKSKRSGPPCQWLRSRKCWKSFCYGNDTNSKRWNFEHLNRSWIGAITWSSALVLGWYTSQIIHLKLKHKGAKKCANINNILCTLRPYVNVVNKGALCNNTENIERILEQFTPTVHLVSNEHSGGNRASNASGSTGSAESSENDLGEVLNSIENKLGLAAIENGQHQVGINMLRSAANRHHAPALYNLGLCYESGLGVTVDEKMAMEFYRSAASMEHPGALYNLSIYYGQGRGGLSRDLETATRLLRLAAVQGQQDAIDALKSLDLDIEPPHIEIDLWPKHHTYLQNDNLRPTHSSLFVENVNFLMPQTPEATLY